MTYEQLCISKIICAAMGLIDRGSITHDEIDGACRLLKYMADQNYNWTDQQKEIYKFLVDFTKEMTKNNAD